VDGIAQHHLKIFVLPSARSRFCEQIELVASRGKLDRRLRVASSIPAEAKRSIEELAGTSAAGELCLGRPDSGKFFPVLRAARAPFVG